MKPARLNHICVTTPSIAGIEDRFITFFGLSSEAFERELEEEFEQATPEERAEFKSLVEQANAVLPEMNATLDRIGETMASMNVTIGEMRESMSSLDKRVSHTEGNVVAAFHVKPLPFRGGVGVGTIRKNRDSEWLTVPTPGPSPKGEGRL